MAIIMNKPKALLVSLLATATISVAFSTAAEANGCPFSKYKSNGFLTNSNLNSGSLWTKIPPIKPDYGIIAGLALSTAGLLGLGSIYLKGRSEAAQALKEAVSVEHPEAPGGALDIASDPTPTDSTPEKETVLI
ncbi:conserved exported hypothetical protein [Planktothrix serta PCC 8927]|uniref:Uncharacterized protein n=2 Tax=Planktothrix TaxID=54304 RepID=A0A7Z9C0S1_9CYAN|nr:conserved exported hypothetical protein [Planktothrix serta PCC 8927]